MAQSTSDQITALSPAWSPSRPWSLSTARSSSSTQSSRGKYGWEGWSGSRCWSVEGWGYLPLLPDTRYQGSRWGPGSSCGSSCWGGRSWCPCQWPGWSQPRVEGIGGSSPSEWHYSGQDSFLYTVVRGWIIMSCDWLPAASGKYQPEIASEKLL